MLEIASLFASITADISDFDKAMKKIDSDLSAQEKGLSTFGNIAGTAFKAIGVAGVAAFGGIVAGGAKAITAAADIEQAAANISATFGDMAPPVEDVKGLINELALDPSLVVGASDAAAAIDMLARNGLDYAEIADGAARSTVLLANATGADLATSADLTTNAMGIFGLQVQDLDGIVATFTNAANKSQFSVNDWGYVLANAGPKAEAMGWKLEELFAAVTLTSSGFSSGQTAGTSWAWLVNGLTPSTDKAANAMKELGLMTEDGANAFFNADGSGKSLQESIGLLQTAFGGLTTEQQMTYSETLFGQEAFGALSGVLGISLDDLNALIPSMVDFSAVEKGAETRTSTFSAAMSALNDTVNAVFVMIGDAFLPVVTDMARTFAAFIKDNAPAVVEWFKTFAITLGTTISWLSEVIDAGTLFNDKFATLPLPLQNIILALTGVVDTITTFVSSVKTITQPITDLIAKYVTWEDVIIGAAIALTVMLWPAIMAAIGAVGAFLASVVAVVAPILAVIAVVAALRFAWENDFGGIQTKTREVFTYIGGIFGPLYETIKKFGGDALGEIIAWATGQETEFTATTAIWEAAKEAFGTLFTDMGNAIVAFGDKAWAEFSKRFPETAKVLSDTWDKTKEGFLKAQTAVTDAIEYLGKTFSPLGTAIKDFGRGALDEIVAWATGNETEFTNTQKIWNVAKETFGTVFTDMGTKLTEWGDIAWTWFKTNFPNAAQALTDAFDSIKENFGELWDAVKPLIDAAVEAFNGLVEDWTTGSGEMSGALEIAKTVMDGVWTIMVAAATYSINTMINVLTLVAQLLTGDWSGAWETAKEIVGGVLTFLDTTVETVLTTVGSLFGLNKEDIKKWYDDTKQNIADWWTNFSTQIGNRDWAGIGRDILKAFDKLGITQWYNETSQKIRDWWENFKTYIKDRDWFKYGVDIVQGLWDGMTSVWKRFTDWLGSGWSGIIGGLDATFEFGSPSKVMKQRGAWIMEGLRDGISDNVGIVTTAIGGLANTLQNQVTSVVGNINKTLSDATPQLDNYYKKLLDAKLAALELASKQTLPVFTPPPVTAPPTLVDPNAGGNGTQILIPATPTPGNGDYGNKKLSLALNGMSAFMDIGDSISDIQTFAARANAFFTGAGQEQLQGSSPAALAIKALTSEGVGTLSVDKVLAAVQDLVTEIRNRGFGTKFDINQAPDATLQQQTELQELVQYLNALYG